VRKSATRRNGIEAGGHILVRSLPPHTTFGTHIDQISISDPEVQRAYELYQAVRREVYGDRAETRPQTLMDIATLSAKVLKQRGLLQISTFPRKSTPVPSTLT
jgi:hypothetical protein